MIRLSDIQQLHGALVLRLVGNALAKGKIEADRGSRKSAGAYSLLPPFAPVQLTPSEFQIKLLRAEVVF
jgi:hypothetical protein